MLPCLRAEELIVAQKASKTNTGEFAKERANFKWLVARNPNYFGNLEKSNYEAILNIVNNTTYEEISCVGYNPVADRLEATVAIKQPFGYGGDLCQPGTTEYVRFFVDYGSGFQDAGLVAFSTHDLSDTQDCAKDPTKPLSYAVGVKLDPKRTCCDKPLLPVVRAILSWENPPPANPNWSPIWGNVVDRSIQIQPSSSIFCLLDAIPFDLWDKYKIDPHLFKQYIPKFPPLPDPPPLELPDLVKLYGGELKTKGAKAEQVEPHRFAFAEVQKLMSAKLETTSTIDTWKNLGLDWSSILDNIQETQGNVSYEELDCLGLDYHHEWLGATFTIKRPSGYSGDLCSAGSTEYVAFWADWDDTCQWTYLDTVKVTVHDIPVPADGLHYVALLPVDLSKYRKSCDTPKIAKVRAVLSWNTPPSMTNPDDVPYWGNRLDAHVQIRHDLGPVELGAHIRSLGGIPVEQIETSSTGTTLSGSSAGLANARFWYNDSPADPGQFRACPFGGQILVHGQWFPGYKYRVSAHKVGTPLSSVVVLGDSFELTPWLPGPAFTQLADGAGFFSYQNPAVFFENNLLASWSTLGLAAIDKDALWEVRLELADTSDTVIGVTPWHRLQLDNTAPDAAITVNGGACKQFPLTGTSINVAGTFAATDANFGSFSLQTLPVSQGQPNPIASVPSHTPTNAGTWNVTISAKCAYVIALYVADRTIVGSQSGQHNHGYDDVSFSIV
jgi:hypothetical protein